MSYICSVKPRCRQGKQSFMSPLQTFNTYRKHLVSLVKDEHLHRVGLQNTTLNHILNTAWSTNNNLRSGLESLHIISNASASNTCMAVDRHEVANGNNDLLDLLSQFASRRKDQSLASLDIGIQLLQDGDGERSGLPGTGLCLCDDVRPCNKRQ